MNRGRSAITLMGVAMLLLQVSADGEVPRTKENWDLSPVIREVCDSLGVNECVMRAENAFLAHSPDVQRTENGISIKLSDGKMLTLDENRSDGDSRLVYFYFGTIEPLAYHLLLMGGNEWSTYVMVHSRTGKRTEMDSFPAVSPDGQRVVTAAINEFGNFENRLQIWSVERDSLASEAVLFPGKINHPNPAIEAWGIQRPRWRGNLEIEAQVRAMRRDEYLRPERFDTTAVFVRRDSTWMLN